jgi:hypothetical protein
MWPFRKKTEGIVAPKEPSWQEQAINVLRDWKPVGGTFTYLGRECVVSGHSRTEYYSFGAYTRPQLRADYADNNGVIHAIEFSWAEAKAIMSKQP